MSNSCEITKIERKKWTDGCTDRINRLRDQYWEHAPALDVQRAHLYTKSYKENGGDETIVRRAKAFRDYFKEKTIAIQPDELVVGIYGAMPRCALVCPEITTRWVKEEIDTMDTRIQDPYVITDQDKKILREEIFPFWEGKTSEDYYWANVTQELMDVAYQTDVIFGEAKLSGGACEFSPDYCNFLIKLGFKGIEELVNNKLADLPDNTMEFYEQRKFYESMLLIVDAAKIQSRRYYEEAIKMADAEQDEKRKKELLEIAQICAKVPYNPPETFREALQFVQFTQLLIWTEENEVGNEMDRLDQYLYPFYKKDIEAGRITKQEAQELMECLWIKFAEIVYCANLGNAIYNAGYQPFHGMTLGGIDEHGEDATNEISFMALQCTIDLQMHAPTLHVRFSKKSSDDFMLKVAELVSYGTGQPAVFFDENVMAALRKEGVEEGDLYRYVTPGCVEQQIPGKTVQWNEGVRFAYSTAVEWALFNGVSPMLGRRVGLETGDPLLFKSYEEFYEAVIKQMDFLIEMCCKNTQIVERAHYLRLPKPMKSFTYSTCISRGKDVMHGGGYYPAGPGIEMSGVADTADSMMAVKKLVFEEKRLSMKELLKALEADFEGFEDLRQILINEAPKYGNDIDEVDFIARDIIDHSCDEAKKYTGIMGSHFKINLVPVTANVAHGGATWALPSGRKKGLPLADGISPYAGYDKNGPTAALKSVCKLDHTKPGGTLLNMKFNPKLFESDEDKMKFVMLMRTEGALGGNHAQYNVVSRETLEEAKIKPSEYSDLLVRVAGYSAYFVELKDDVQDDIIQRTEIQSY